MDDDRSLPRFLAPGPCHTGDIVRLAAPQSRHMVTVLRRRMGDRVRVFTGDGREYLASIEQAHPQGAAVRIGEPFRPERPSPTRLVLAFAPAPGQRTDALVEKATELGATCLQPLLCERLQGFQGHAASRRTQRWQRKAEEAARQAQRTSLPELLCPVTLDAFLADCDCALRLLADPAGASLWDALAAQAERPASVAMAVGPAGGFTRRELELAAEAQFAPVSLGPHVLRVETAALSVLATLAAWLAGGEQRGSV